MIPNSILKLLFIPVICATAFHVVAYFWYPADVAFSMLLGTVECCTWEQAMESRRIAEEQERRATEPVAGYRLLRNEGEFGVWETPNGPLWLPRDTEYEPGGGGILRWQIVESVAPAITPGAVVIDCGGHTGGSARAALSMGASKVISFEPHPVSAECMRRNLKSEIESGRLILYEKGVWDKEEKLFLSQGDHGADASVNEEGGFAIDLTTIDKVVAELGIDRVDFIKMDIEGSEQKAIVGARETIRRFKPKMAIGSYHRADDLEEIPRRVNDIRTDYEMTGLRCLSAYGKIMPHLLYFH